MCQYECDVIDSDVVSLPTKDDFSLIAPFRILSFDIECCAEEGGFPSPEKDAVITIANVVTEQVRMEVDLNSRDRQSRCSSPCLH